MVFVLATYGEGNPIDNANTFFDTFQPESCEEQQARQTEILCMRSWEYHLRLYTRSVAVVDEKFTAAGAEKLGYIGKADKTGCPTTTEEAFSQWKEDMFHILGQRFGRKERAVTYQSGIGRDGCCRPRSGSGGYLSGATKRPPSSRVTI